MHTRWSSTRTGTCLLWWLTYTSVGTRWFYAQSTRNPQNEMVLHPNEIRKRAQQQLPHAERTKIQSAARIVFDALPSHCARECETHQRVMQQKSGSHTVSWKHDIDGFVASSGGPSLATFLTLTLWCKDTLQINTKEVPNDLIERFLDLKLKPPSWHRTAKACKHHRTSLYFFASIGLVRSWLSFFVCVATIPIHQMTAQINVFVN